ncbi:retropepsin-like aspartic protease family protein [Lichenibacterium dinghuense]|uniref:retropepsin-like aspartic protease family protein n=1 Tax=Lichenibacterium dinghuense TaxID=2895977 RepID=UPI001F02A370|nr:TIGR02281 family clan AA aspartic protease [Lichenibacterium sp. 6Y81]
MGVVKGAVGCAVVALLAGHQLSSLDAGRRIALWDAAREAIGARAPDPPPPRLAQLAQAAPAVAAASPFGEEWIGADRLGQFQTTVEIDGQRLPVLVDTGATFVCLSAEDADRVGVHPAPSDYRYAVNTANGSARVAKVQLASVRLGGIELRDVAALVSGRGQLGQTLLGMSFLSRLSTVRIDRGRLVLAR